MPLYFRKDATVQNALGQALAGAHVFVCLQPAVINPTQPTPLAVLFSDPDGIMGPLDNPVRADGTGNVFYYAAPDFYTEIYTYQGRIQKVLVDQAVGV